MKKLNLAEFMGALSLESATENTCQQIIDAGNDTIEKILSLSIEQIAVVGQDEARTIGQLRAVKIHRSLHSPRVQGYLFHAEDWVTEVVEEIKPQSGISLDLTGKKVCFTGAANISRKQLTDLLKSLGAKVQSGVSSKTDILFIADPDSTSNKAKKARALGIEIKAYSEIGA